jgi:hypothetical protein
VLVAGKGIDGKRLRGGGNRLCTASLFDSIEIRVAAVKTYEHKACEGKGAENRLPQAYYHKTMRNNASNGSGKRRPKAEAGHCLVAGWQQPSVNLVYREFVLFRKNLAINSSRQRGGRGQDVATPRTLARTASAGNPHDAADLYGLYIMMFKETVRTCI